MGSRVLEWNRKGSGDLVSSCTLQRTIGAGGWGPAVQEETQSALNPKP